jgi:glucose-6-phosphate dehydrogenase assembly protein OpcA
VMIPTRPRSRWSPGAARPMTMASASLGALAQMMIIRSAEY